MTNTWVGIDVGPTAQIGSPDPTTITGIRIEVDAGASPILLDRFETTSTADTGRVMIQFDDNRASVATAYEEMHQRSLAGGIAVIPDLVGSGGHLTAAQLATYHDSGWDLVSHPQLDRPLPAYSRARQRAAIVRAKRWLVERGYEAGANHFVVPFGSAGPETLDLMATFHATGFLSSAGMSGTPPADPLTINRVGIDNVQYAKRQIRRAAAYNQLVVLSAHTVGNADDRWVSREGFVDMLDTIEKTDVTVVTPTEYWNEIIDN